MAVMDQTAFRQLVSLQNSSSSAGGGGGSTNAGRNHEQQSKRVFGKSQKRTGAAGSNSTEGHSSKFIIRKLGKSSESKEEEEEAEEETSERIRLKKLLAESYTDRAAARRSGKEEKNEFHEIEKLKEDFYNRLKNANDELERQQLRDQMAFLGGDAKHTVLVNGLDFALLEQQRAKLNGDDDLENAFHSAATSERKAENIANNKSATITKNDKFKPIGRSKPKEEESPEYIWRNGKRMRKKRKGKGNVEDARDITSDTTGTSSKSVEIQPKRAKVSKKTEGKKEVSDTSAKASNNKDEKDHTTKPLEASEKAAKAVNDTPAISPPSTTIQAAIGQDAPAQESDDEDEDIFADAGRWNGFAEEVSDEEGSV